MTTINIPLPLRQYAGQHSCIEVSACTVSEALSHLVTNYPDLGRRIFSDDGSLRGFVNVYVNNEDIRYLEREATVVKDGDNIYIVPSIAGGR
jgi:molybdopterin converting factor small subunit